MFHVITEILVCILAGAGAGIGTGFAGLSAAAFIAPMLVAFLRVPVFDAVGIALASDVLASAVSAAAYAREGNIDLKNGRLLMACVLTCTVLGSIAGFAVTTTETGDTVMGFWSILASFLLGIRFLIPSGKGKEKEKREPVGKSGLVFLFGAYIGIVCGFQGAGGGLMMLFVLTSVMRFEYKKAVGTSVFIMSFTACIGAVSHFIMNGIPDPLLLSVCIVSTLVFARISAVAANRMQTETLHRITGCLLTGSGAVMLVVKCFLQ